MTASAGTTTSPPASSAGDRVFRPDIQGLRAIAVLVVVFSHAQFAGFKGGFVGVDVFFVISGYVITGLLLRERERTQHTSFLTFYARRARRIVPSAALVIVVTVVATFHFLDFIAGGAVVPDATSAALFYSNFHFIHTGTTYANLGAAPSPLQNYWSLAVEEQFYLLFPALLAVTALVARRRRLEPKLAIVIAAVCAVSFCWSVIETRSNGVAAYFSTATRAWELGLGCLVAVSAQAVGRRLTGSGACAVGWLGGLLIALSVVTLHESSRFPGYLALLPTLGAALIIVGGIAQPRGGIETVLRLAPLQWIGDISFTLYLVHWPIFVIAAEHASGPLSLAHRVVLVLCAVAVAAVVYYAYEARIRRSSLLARQPVIALSIVPVSIAVVIVVCLIELHTNALPLTLF